MIRICWWLLDVVSRMLDRDERDAAIGDVVESGETAGQALRGVLGLIARRQAALWKNWRPWLVLVGLVAPVGLLLSLSSISLDRSYDLYLWIFRNYGTIDPVILAHTGLTVRHGIVRLVCGSLLLGSRSWITGFVLASLSRRTIWINGAAFCVVLIFAELSGTLNRRYLYDVNGGIFSLTFYSVIFPLILQTILVVLPSLWGIRQGLRMAGPPLVKTMLWGAAILVALTISNWSGSPFRAVRLIPVVGYWPVGYIVAAAIRRHWRYQTAAAN